MNVSDRGQERKITPWLITYLQNSEITKMSGSEMHFAANYGVGRPACVVLIDDHPIIRLGARIILEKDGDFVVVGEAEDVDSGTRLVSDLKPDLVVLDLNLPDGSGFEVLNAIRGANQSARVLIYSASSSKASVIQSKLLGADGFLKKAISSDEILEAARNTMMVEHSIQEAGVASLEHPLSLLSSREYEVLGCLSRGLAPESIANELGISTKTVSSHKRNLLNKVGLNFVELLWLYSEFKRA